MVDECERSIVRESITGKYVVYSRQELIQPRDAAYVRQIYY